MSDTERCAHCDLAVPEAMRRPEGPSFCCTGCEAVYHALSSSGLEQFYRWRDVGVGGAEAGPVGDLAEPDRIPRELFIEHAEALGDDTLRTQLRLEGIHCAGCVWLIEQMPRHLDGVFEAHVEVSRGRLQVRWDPHTLEDPNELIRWLGRFGYEARPLSAQRVAGHSSAERAMLRRVGVTWALAGNVMLLSAAHYAGMDLMREPALAAGARWLMLALTTGALVYGADVMLRRAWASARTKLGAWLRGQAGPPLSMDVPLALGVLIGWGYSARATLLGSGELWLDSVAMLIAAILTARWLQQRANQAARQAAERLLALLPRTARRVEPDGQIVQVGVDRLTLGDLVEVRAGDVVPVDGRIEHGEASLHRGVLTGESRPERAGPGDPVEAGTTNLDGALRVRVQASGDRTRMGQLMEWIEGRAHRRAPVVQLADRLGGWFVLGVLALAAIIGAAWAVFDPPRAVPTVIAVLVISCPCALSMATPLALAVAGGRAARRGIFIKHDDVLEALSGLEHVVLDKTGTLTHGQMRLVEHAGDPEALAWAVALEARSDHPIARAITSGELAPAEGVEVTLDEERAGAGLLGHIDGRPICVGRPDWVLDQVEGPALQLAAQARQWADRGASPVLVAVDGRAVAAMAARDQLRPESLELIEQLRDRGARPVILSGDHPAVVDAVGAQLGLPPEDVHGGMSPEDKLAHILRLKERGQLVAMVGDGVNDAAAMQAADVGIAVRGGAEVSLVAADIFLTRQGLRGIGELVEGADGVMRTIRRHMRWALGYNILGIGLASTGVVTPLLAAILMPLSSAGLAAASIFQGTFEEPEEREPGGASAGAAPVTKLEPVT